MWSIDAEEADKLFRIRISYDDHNEVIEIRKPKKQRISVYYYRGYVIVGIYEIEGTNERLIFGGIFFEGQLIEKFTSSQSQSGKELNRWNRL